MNDRATWIPSDDQLREISLTVTNVRISARRYVEKAPPADLCPMADDEHREWLYRELWHPMHPRNRAGKDLVRDRLGRVVGVVL